VRRSELLRSRRPLLLALLFLASLLQPPAFGATSSTFFVTQTPSIGAPLVSLHGVVKPAVAGAAIRILTKDGERWIDSGLRTKTGSLGTWKVRTTVEDASQVDFKAEIDYQSRTFTTSERSITLTPALTTQGGDPASLITKSGPGARIYGSDVSRWQHPNDQSINFKKMYKAGMRFVMIKASDTRDDSDALARKYLAMDRHAAQAAGLYTGFYHYATPPNTTSRRVVIEDAKAQAQRAIWRLASVGGYTELDLPYALDFENNCVSYSGKRCIKYSSRKFNTLWAETWLDTVYEKTGRKPFLYSYPAFLERALNRSAKLRTYPLWLSHFGINPAKERSEPGRKVVGCYVHSWSTSDCTSLWQIWQFSSCGIASKYGVPGSRLDLNVYRGDVESFLRLTRGVWEPLQGDLLPVNESTTMVITNIKSTTTDKKVEIQIDVRRINGDPVITGSVELIPDPALDTSTVTIRQASVRDSSGRFTISVKGYPAGTHFGEILFKDPTKTHAKSMARVEFSLLQGPEPTPKPQVSKPAIKNPTLDGCKRQIRM